MKPITNTLLDFLDKHISAKLSNIPKIHFSVKSSKLLGDIFHHFKDAETNYNRTTSTPSTTSTEFRRSPTTYGNSGSGSLQTINMRVVDKTDGLLKGNDYHFIPPHAREHIENTYHYQNTYSFKIKNREFVVGLVYPHTKTKMQANHFFEESMKRIYMWLYTASIYAPANCSNTLHIYLYFTDLMKTLPTHGTSIDQINANTAATRSCNKTNEIHLYREEEWFKVLIHECFHCFGLDFSEYDCSKTTKYILQLFPVKSDVLLFETYCEMWAEILNVMFISYLSTKHVENLYAILVDKMIKKTAKMLEKEQEFSLFQCIKVLHFYGLDYNDLHKQTVAAHSKRTNQYNEKTNILSYYILKSIYMFSVDDFIEWCANNNHNSINFNKSANVLHKSQEDYCKFIFERYKDPLYIESANALTKWFDKMENKKIVEKIESRTLRMSVYEL